MKNTRDSYKNLSEKSSLYRYQTLKIPGNTKHYLEFYRLVLVVGQCLVYRGSIGKDASTLRYCSTREQGLIGNLIFAKVGQLVPMGQIDSL